MNKLKKILKTPIKDYLLLLETFFTMAFIRFIIIIIPMKKIALHLGKQTEFSDFNPVSPINKIKIQRIQLSIARSIKISFWRCNCYEQAFTAKILLKRKNIKSTIYFGVRKNFNENKTEGHAWLRVGQTIVTGQKTMFLFKEILCFS